MRLLAALLVRPAFWALGLLLMAFLAAPTMAAAADQEPPFLRDLLLTMQARKALLEDPVLGTLNLGVKVKNRVAVLWGPAPSIQVKQRAEERLRAMIEFTHVVDLMHVTADDWPGLLPVQPPQAAPRQVLPDLLPPIVPPLPDPPLERMRREQRGGDGLA